ncbi:hypothetical protein B0O80DRAFT_150134 [Mortierella sp. GBAus27b]|nr:hypothetical protein B0O80DRAFT_150134 [Mortierella sp. GBAus27b]
MESPSRTSTGREREVFDEEAAFSFRKKKTTRGPLSPPPRSQFRSPLSRSPSNRSLASRVSASSSTPRSASRSPSVSRHAFLLGTNMSRWPKPSSSSHRRSPTISPSFSYMPSFTVRPKRVTLATDSESSSTTTSRSQDIPHQDKEKEPQEWDLVWKGSWIVPVLEPFNPTSSTSSSSSSLPAAGSSTGLSSSRKGPISLKKTGLDSRQNTLLQGRNGVKLQPRVSELSGMTFVISKYRPPSNDSEPTAASFASAEEKQIMRENTEMHLISKIQLDTFPMFLLMPGCKEPCLSLPQRIRHQRNSCQSYFDATTLMI